MRVSATQNFRRNLARELMNRGLSQRELAQKAKITFPYVNRLLTGKAKNPSVDLCEQIAKALGLKLVDMI